jgi:hypothetical protein
MNLQTVGNNLSVPDLIKSMELTMLKEDQVSCPVYHHFSPGIYIREVHLPAGTLAIGHKQKTVHLNVFLKGRVTMVNEDGSTYELSAPQIFTSQPGRKFGYIHEDVVWLNIYPTNETDISTLEDTFLEKSDEWKENSPVMLDKIADREDYKKLLNDYGITEETVRFQSENKDDLIDFPSGTYCVGVFDSPIEGKGIFAMADIKEGELVAPARIGGMRTPAGRYTNHSMDPNAEMRVCGGDILMYAVKNIKGCSGGLLGEEITTNYRKTIELGGKIK